MDFTSKLLVKIISASVILLIILIIYYLINIGNQYVDDRKKVTLGNREWLPIFLIILIAIIIYYLIKKYNILFETFKIIISSVIFAYLINPIVNILEKKNIPRFWGVLIIYISFIAIISIISFVFVPNIIREFKNLIVDLPEYINGIYDYINKFYLKYAKNIDNLPPIFQGIKDALIDNIGNVENSIMNSIRRITDSMFSLFSRIITFVTIPILTFYFLKDKDYFKRKVFLAIPKQYRKDTVKIAKEIDRALSEFIRGRLIVAVFVGVSTTLALLLLRVNFAFLIGMLAGIADIIPYFGPVIGIIPAVFFALLESPIRALWVIIIFIIIQQVENDIITPKIIGESMGLHPVTVILSLIVGGGLFKIIGMLLAVPAIAVFKIIFTFLVDKLNRTQY
jgi:predicted PurR-regulated permease PerM